MAAAQAEPKAKLSCDRTRKLKR